jgi:hypothetical protein
MLLNPYLLTWVVLAIAALALAGYRFTLGNREDDTLHLKQGEASMIAFQMRVANRIRLVAHIGAAVTTIAVIYGMVLFAYWAYGVWRHGSAIAFH